MSDENQGRRRFLKLAMVGAAAAPIAVAMLPRLGRADDLPHLDPNDPTAKALGYTEDATKATANAAYKKGAVCFNCQFFQGHEEMAYAPCTLFPGKVVNSKGWCASHSDKT
ncbi:MAG: high-potential iron-sulfur protein [Lysobacterales bacterium]